MASTTSPAATSSPYRCSQCDQKPPSLSLCGRCKTARYCDHDCQKAAWPTHKAICVDVHGPNYYHVPPMKTGVDPAGPSNPLQLRTRPSLSDEEILKLSTCEGVVPTNGLSVAQIKAMREVASNRIHISAVRWVFRGEKDEDLCRKDQDEIAVLLKEWVYERSRTFAQIKALRIRAQSTTFQLFNPGSGPSIASASLLATAAERMVASQYLDLRMEGETTRGTWLHKSLLKKVPADHDYRSRFHHGQVRCTPENDIVASLLALGVAGIDEGSFWDLEDARDELKLQANDALFDVSQLLAGMGGARGPRTG